MAAALMGGGVADDDTGLVCAVVSCIAGCETSHALLISQLELGLEEGKCPFRSRAQAECVGCGGKETSLFKHSQSESNDCEVRNGKSSERGNALNVCDFGP